MEMVGALIGGLSQTLFCPVNGIAAQAADEDARKAERAAAAAGAARLAVADESNAALRELLADAQAEVAALRELLTETDRDLDAALDWIGRHRADARH